MLSTLNTTNVFSGNGVTYQWTYTFQIETANGSDVEIWLTSPAGQVSEVTTSYSIDVNTATVTYPTVASGMPALPSGWTLTLKRVENLVQDTDLGGTTTEDALDYITAAIQQVDYKAGLGVAGPTGPTGSMLNDGAMFLLTEKTSIVDNDIVLIEDSADGYKNKKLKRSNLDAAKLGGKIVGTSAYNILALDSAAKIPAVDGSQLTGLPTPTVGTSGTFVNSDLSTGVLTVTHSKNLSTPFQLIVQVIDNNRIRVEPDVVTFATKDAFTIDLTSYGTLSGTWGYRYI